MVDGSWLMVDGAPSNYPVIIVKASLVHLEIKRYLGSYDRVGQIAREWASPRCTIISPYKDLDVPSLISLL